MAGIFQMSSGYRDPAKSMTVKALEARLKSAQEASAQATQMQQPISDPMQGYAYLGNILASGLKESRAEYQGGAARDELAKIKAGIDWNKGPTGEQYAAMSTLDPEGADKIMQDWVNYRQDLEKQAKQNEFQTSERLGGETFTAGQQTGRQTFEASQTEDQQAAAIELAKTNQEMDVTEQKRKEQAEIDKIGQTTDARLAEGQKLGLTGEALQRYAATGNMPLEQDKFNTPAAQKDIASFKLQGSQIDSTLNTLGRARDILDKGTVLQGDLALKVLNTAGSVPGGTKAVQAALKAIGINLTDEQVADTLEFDSIMGLSSTEHMANTLVGQSSNLEMQSFRRDMANPNAPASVRRAAVQRMWDALLSDRAVVDTTLQGFGQTALNPYEYKSSAPAVPNDSNTTTTTTGGGGGQRDPATMTAAERERERRELMGQ